MLSLPTALPSLMPSGITHWPRTLHWENVQLGKRVGVLNGEVLLRSTAPAWRRFQLAFPTPVKPKVQRVNWPQLRKYSRIFGPIWQCQRFETRTQVQVSFTTTKWKYKGSNSNWLRQSTFSVTFIICSSVIPLISNDWTDNSEFYYFYCFI